MKRGFTLIETILYIALFGLIMSGCLLTVWNIVEGMSRVNTRTAFEEEGNFVLRKIGWALSSATSTSINTSVPCSHTLHVVENGGDTVDFRRNSTSFALEMQENGGGYLAITTANASTTCLTFQSVSVGSLKGVTATTTLNGEEFSITRYLRK